MGVVITMVGIIVAGTITITGVDIEMDTTIIEDIDTIMDSVIEHNPGIMAIIRIKRNTIIAINIIDRVILVSKMQTGLQETEAIPKIKPIQEREVITKIHQEQEIQHITEVITQIHQGRVIQHAIQVAHTDINSYFSSYSKVIGRK